jgi:hypothetical protein
MTDWRGEIRLRPDGHREAGSPQVTRLRRRRGVDDDDSLENSGDRNSRPPPEHSAVGHTATAVARPCSTRAGKSIRCPFRFHTGSRHPD